MRRYGLKMLLHRLVLLRAAAGFPVADAVLAQLSFALFKRLQHGQLTLVTPRGRRFVFHGLHAGAKAELMLHDWQVMHQAIMRGDTGFAESYMDGKWETPDLAELFIFALQNKAAMETLLHGSWAQRIWFWVQNTILRANSRAGSRANIMAHYDLGNDFYRLWLDETMTYSAAIFEGDLARPLAHAQHAKYQRILSQICVGKTGQRILEIGCGWGGFAEEAIHRDQQVVGLTLSPAQREWAIARLAPQQREQGQVDIRLQDYRDVDGQFDAIVSIEMFEAVGERYWGQYFSTIASRVKPGGRALVQAITIADEEFARYRRSGDFIRQYVFPGGMLISPSRFNEEVKKARMRVVDAHAMGLDYAYTLQLWLERFNQVEAEVRAQGFDELFIRLWRLYLAMCIASFTVGHTNVYQFTLEHV